VIGIARGILRGIAVALLAASAALAPASRALAQTPNWPTRPIKLIVPTGPGLGTDIMARFVAAGISPRLGQQVYVENISGASGILGAHAAAHATPDGYTFFFANASTFTSNRYMIKSIGYDPAHDFVPVAMISDSGPFVISVTPSLPVKTLPELIAYGKANPGKLSYAVDTTSGYGVVVGRLLNTRGKIGMVEVPYRATPQMLQDTASGTIQVVINVYGAVYGFAKSGKVRPIAISSARRFSGSPDLPTIADVLPGFEIDGWLCIVAPAGTPAEMVNRLSREIDQFLQKADTRQRLLSLGLASAGTNTPETTGQFIRKEEDKWSVLAKELDLKPE
jgi:tripartite-type tricarboxylate transporter receptor subunit TctC